MQAGFRRLVESALVGFLICGTAATSHADTESTHYIFQINGCEVLDGYGRPATTCITLFPRDSMTFINTGPLDLEIALKSWIDTKREVWKPTLKVIHSMERRSFRVPRNAEEGQEVAVILRTGGKDCPPKPLCSDGIITGPSIKIGDGP